MSREDAVRVERDGNLGWIRLDRPERLNAFAGTMREQLADALQTLDGQAAIRCVAITGVGRAFSAGGDVDAMAELSEARDESGFEDLVRAGMRIVRVIDRMDKPVIAAVNGVAAGAGASLALACDLRVASTGASIGLTFTRVGLHPDWGASYFLPRLLGAAVAAELIFTGGMINAKRAERLGLVNRVVPAEELEGAVRGLASQIAGGPADVIADAKRTLRRSLAEDLDTILELEAAAQLRAFRSPAFEEGIRAFLEKRAPRFGG